MQFMCCMDKKAFMANISKQVTVRKRQWKTRASEKQVTYVEALYASGNVRWHAQEDLLALKDNKKTFAFKTVQDYLAACSTDLARWAGRLQHGLGGARSPPATPEYLQAWRDNYMID